MWCRQWRSLRRDERSFCDLRYTWIDDKEDEEMTTVFYNILVRKFLKFFPVGKKGLLSRV
jgi:hypothetical protein